MNGSISPACKLTKDDVQVWIADLSRFAHRLESFRSLLSTEERARAGRFSFQRDERRFVLSHGLLRRLLARYLDSDPAALVFHYSEYGKPALKLADMKLDVRFNISHSTDHWACVVSLDRDVGVDLEVIRADIDHLQLAQRFFSAREYEDIAGRTHDEQKGQFFRYWTCKEAYLKARGLGLASGLAQVEVLVGNEGAAVSLLNEPFPADPRRWKIAPFDVAGEIAAAVAAAGEWDLTVATLSCDV